jgi:steroid 5-alpha reductase family enzyme
MIPAALAGTTSERRRGWRVLAVAYLAALAAALVAGRLLTGRSPILVAGVGDVVATVVVFAFSVAHDNSSVYDPYWSVAPVPIALYWAAGGAGGARAGAVVLLVLAWGVRLTANQLARWEGPAHEDFRYRALRARAGRAYWPVSLVAIHLLPTGWVFLALLPVYAAVSLPGRPPGPLDALAAVVGTGAIGLEAAADLQLRSFLRRRRDPAEVLAAGLWARVRHPNYLGEILFWWALWLFGLAAAPRWAWTAVGPLAVTLLFLRVSVPWMDRRMLAGHPSYAERLRTAGGLLPRWRRR